MSIIKDVKVRHELVWQTGQVLNTRQEDSNSSSKEFLVAVM